MMTTYFLDYKSESM